jgi:hypothetical protein
LPVLGPFIPSVGTQESPWPVPAVPAPVGIAAPHPWSRRPGPGEQAQAQGQGCGVGAGQQQPDLSIAKDIDLLLPFLWPSPAAAPASPTLPARGRRPAAACRSMALPANTHGAEPQNQTRRRVPYTPLVNMPRPEIFSKFQSRKFAPQKASGTSSSGSLPPGMMPGPKKFLIDFWPGDKPERTRSWPAQGAR